MLKPKLTRKQAYLQALDEHKQRGPKLCTVYEFTYRGVDFYAAHDVRSRAYWNVYDVKTGLAVWNGFARKTRNDAITAFTSENNVQRFINYLQFIKTDSYRKLENDFYFAVRAAQNRQGED